MKKKIIINRGESDSHSQSSFYPPETKEQQVAFFFTVSIGQKIQNVTEPKCFPKLRCGYCVLTDPKSSKRPNYAIIAT